jgi:hypothetical protein
MMVDGEAMYIAAVLKRLTALFGYCYSKRWRSWGGVPYTVMQSETKVVRDIEHLKSIEAWVHLINSIYN